jgi:hypothetical protein
MKITLVGAAGGEVTGSCYIVQAKQAPLAKMSELIEI